jgi:hypothetical protein
MTRIRSLWLLPLLASTAAAQWLERSPANVPPSRGEPGMTYDFFRGRTVLFGGGGVGSPLTIHNDTWTWNGLDWTQASPAVSPSGRFGTSLAFDLARGVVVMYGGLTSLISAAQPVGETWEWDGSTWAQITTAATPGRLAYHGFAYDTVRGLCVLYGGSSNPNLLIDSNQTWEYDGVNWMHRTPATNPGFRERPAMCFHSGLGRTLLFGGIDVQVGGNDQTWTWDGTNWTQVPVAGVRPAPRTLAQMVYDYGRNTGLMQGGMNPITGALLPETWEFNGTTWRQVQVPQPTARRGFAMSYDYSLGKTVMFGGSTGNFQPLVDTQEYGASVTPLGPGCPGSNGVPVLASAMLPRLGTTFSSTLTNLATGASFGVMLAGLSSTTSGLGALPLPMAGFGAPGCNLLVSPDVSLFLPVVGGVLTNNLNIPANPNLIGVQLFQQGISLDAAVNAAGAVLSNAITITVGG